MADKLTPLEQEIQVDRKYAAAAGYFLIAFSHLEEEMNRSIWALLGIANDARAFVVTTAMRDFGQRMLLLAKLGKAHLSGRNRDDCADVIRATQFINDRRVELVHGTFAGWDSERDCAIIARATADRTEVRHSASLLSTDYLCDLTTFTLTAARAFTTFRHNVRDGRSQALPSLDTRPERPA